MKDENEKEVIIDECKDNKEEQGMGQGENEDNIEKAHNVDATKQINVSGN